MLSVSHPSFSVQPADLESFMSAAMFDRARDEANDDLRCLFDAAEKLVAAAVPNFIILLVQENKQIMQSHGERTIVVGYTACISTSAGEHFTGTSESFDGSVLAALRKFEQSEAVAVA